MKGGNGATNGSVVTLCSKGEIPYCVAENAPWMASVSDANLTACSQGNAEASKKILNAATALTRWFADVSSAEASLSY